MGNPAQSPTLKEIAIKAGVSVATVSLSLRKHPRIPASTRLQIQKIAEAMGYQPDPLLSALSARRRPGKTFFRGVLAWVSPSSHPEYDLKNAIHRKIWEGASERAAQWGFKIDPFWLKEPGLTPSAATHILHNRGIHGLIVAPPEKPYSRLKLHWPLFSAVSVGHTLFHPRLHNVVNNQFRTVIIAFRKLRALGHRRIALLATEGEHSGVANVWVAGFLGEQFKLNKPDWIAPYVKASLAEKPVVEWIRKARPTAIIVKSHLVSDWLVHAGFRIPQDISIALLATAGAPTFFAGVDIRTEMVGRTAVDLLISLMQRNEKGIPTYPTRTMLEGTWKNGGSIRRLNV